MGVNVTTDTEDGDIAQLKAEAKFSQEPDVALAEMNAEADALLKPYADQIDSEDNLGIDDANGEGEKLVNEFQRRLMRVRLLAIHVGAMRVPFKPSERVIQ